MLTPLLRNALGSFSVGASAVFLLAIAAAGAACGDDASAGVAPTSDIDAAPVGPMITVTTLAPARTTAPAAKASATWTAYRLDEGEWQVLTPAATGTYAFPLPSSRWAVAVVCAANDNGLTTVQVHRRTRATTSLEVSLEDQCVDQEPPSEFTLTGTLSNVPPTTMWLDFGYARDSRGVTLPLSGTVATYEMVGIERGTWDLALGIRNDPAGALTHMTLRRGEVVEADKAIDLDVVGAQSFVPSSKPLVLHGLLAGDSVSPRIYYAAGGPFGIDVGPQDVPQVPPDPSLAYATVPEALQLPGDRYRGTIVAEQDRRTGGRTIMFDIHAAIDLSLTFLPDAPPPVLSVASAPGASLLRIETKLPVLANAVRHEVLAVAMLNRRTSHAWQASYDAAWVGGAAEIVDTMPDLSSLTGWKTEWGLPAGTQVSVTATGYESPAPLGDGTMQRVAGKGAAITP